MPDPNLIILYVKDPSESAAFYGKLLDRAPFAAFPTYVAFALEGGLTLGLWSTSARDFVSSGTSHRAELAIMVETDRAVEALYEEWRRKGVTIEQEPMNAVFGRTFVALDPDGHRIRVCTPD
jgi:Lactoylglutathione lyase and related lyases